MKFSYSAVWDDTLGLLRQHGRLLAAIAGVFLFMPALLVAQLLPPPQPTDPARVLEAMMDYYAASWPWLLLQALASIVGTVAMLRLVFARTSVADALLFGLMLLPFYLLLSLITVVIVALGLILLIVPGVYLIGRLATAAPLMVAENRRNPVAALTRSFEISRGHGWAIAGLIFLVAIVAAIVIGVVSILIGIVFILIGGQDLGRLLTSVLGSALNAGFATLVLMLYAAIYRALAGKASVASTFE